MQYDWIKYANFALDVLKLLLPLVGVLLAVYIYLDVTPQLRLRILSRPIDRVPRKYILRLEIENSSKTPIIKHEKGILLQIIEYNLSEFSETDHFVPFTFEDFEKMAPEKKPKIWIPPRPVFDTSTHWFPGDLVAIEQVITLSSDEAILHVGLQFYGRVPAWVDRLHRWRGVKRPKDWERWTTTTFVGHQRPPEKNAQ